MKLLIVLAFITSISFASDYELCSITTDANEIFSVLGIGVGESGEIESFYSVACEEGHCTNYSYPIEKIGAGIVVEEGGGYDVITILSDNFSLHSGGELTIRYLSNGIWGTFEEFELKLVNDGAWSIRTVDGEDVQHMHFISRKLFKGVIGIKGVELN